MMCPHHQELVVPQPRSPERMPILPRDDSAAAPCGDAYPSGELPLNGLADERRRLEQRQQQLLWRLALRGAAANPRLRALYTQVAALEADSSATERRLVALERLARRAAAPDIARELQLFREALLRYQTYAFLVDFWARHPAELAAAA
jgi:hypothetical protein